MQHSLSQRLAVHQADGRSLAAALAVGHPRKRHQAPGLRTVPSLAREPAQIIRAVILTQSQRRPHQNPSASRQVFERARGFAEAKETLLETPIAGASPDLVREPLAIWLYFRFAGPAHGRAWLMISGGKRCPAYRFGASIVIRGWIPAAARHGNRRSPS
jgi:hypothetical protein